MMPSTEASRTLRHSKITACSVEVAPWATPVRVGVSSSTVATAETPRVRDEDRVTVEPMNDDFKKVTIRYGFMEDPNVPKALAQMRKRQGVKFDIMATSFFLGRRSVVASANSGMPMWQDRLYIFLMRNATNPTDFFSIPPGRVVELGAQVTV